MLKMPLNTNHPTNNQPTAFFKVVISFVSLDFGLGGTSPVGPSLIAVMPLSTFLITFN